jgi:hypothetical protein
MDAVAGRGHATCNRVSEHARELKHPAGYMETSAVTQSYVLERYRWTHADFDVMGWHDVVIHGIAFRPDEWAIAFDIDYILQWVDPAAGEATYRFWIAPATLVFESVAELQVHLDSSGELSLECIERGAPLPTREGFEGLAQEWPWVLDCNEGEITFTATGYHQVIRQAPRLQGRQSLTWAERGGVSFSEEPPAGATA